MVGISVKNEKLYCALISLAKVILEIVSRKDQDDPILTGESVWVKTDEGYYEIQQIQQKRLNFTLALAQNEITNTLEFSDFKDIVNTDEVISPQLNTLVGTYASAMRLEAVNIAFWPVHIFLTDQGIEEFNILKFDAVYSKMERDLYENKIEFENVTPLCGFTMEDSEISLTDNISIVRLSEKDILEFFNLGIKLGPNIRSGDMVLEIHPYAIKQSYKLPKRIGEEFSSLKGREQNEYLSNKNEQAVIDALRIYKEGKLYAISTVKRSRGILVGTRSFTFETPVNHRMTNQYKLLKSEFEDFKSFWRKKTNNPLLETEKSFLSVAIRRFTQSNERDNLEDRIIDLMIAAEAIFLSSGGGFQGELKYRLSHRASMFIETDVDRQRYLFDFMKKAYDVRSAIVHGSNPNLPKKMDGSTYTLYEFCGDIEKYLRISIKKAIDQTAAIDWDSVIFPTVS